jgi:hypothetical protein
VGVLLVFLLINVGFLFLYQDKANHAAYEAARHINNGYYWLGMTRPDFQGRKAVLEDQAQGLANSTLSFLGMPNLSNWKVNYTPIPVGTKEQTEALVVTVSFDVSGLRTISGGFFPPFLNIKAVGVASEAATKPYAMSVLNFKNTSYLGSTGSSRAIRLPIYDAEWGGTPPVSSGEPPGNYPVIPGGPIPGGPVPVAYMPVFNPFIANTNPTLPTLADCNKYGSSWINIRDFSQADSLPCASCPDIGSAQWNPQAEPLVESSWSN